ncbi:Cysteine desulfurase IscS, partial [Durusdinium trenchii]
GEMTFMSNGTETINQALKGLAEMGEAEGRRHFITQASEHVAVLEVCKALERHGCEVTYLPVDAEGLVNPQTLEAAITPRTICVSIMHSNNETGALQPIKEIVQRVRKASNRVYVHCDASQSLGKLPVDVNKLDVDLLTMAGHKLYAPKGVGALYKRSTVPALPPLLHGAGQESGRRASTENVIHIVGLGKACEIARRDLEKNQKHMQEMRDRLYQQLLQGLGSKAWRPDPGKSWSLRATSCVRTGRLRRGCRTPCPPPSSRWKPTHFCPRQLMRLQPLRALPVTVMRCTCRMCLRPWELAKNGPWAPAALHWAVKALAKRWIKRRRSWPRLP